MGRKKRKAAQLKPFCYYCDREFDDEKVLIQHQKAKHFKCSECNRKLDTATGLVVHMLQVHKETISRVPNANPGRDNPDDIIHGMAGVPAELLNAKQAKLDEERGATKHQKSAHTVFGMSVMSGFFNQMYGGGAMTGAPPASGFPFMGGAPGMMATPPGAFGVGGAMGANGAPNAFTFSQFLAQMSQGPQAAFNALTSGAMMPGMMTQPLGTGNIATPFGALGGQAVAPAPSSGTSDTGGPTPGPSSTVKQSDGQLYSASGAVAPGSGPMGGFRSIQLPGRSEDTESATTGAQGLPGQWTAAAPSVTGVPGQGPSLSGKFGLTLPTALGLGKRSKLVFDPPDDTISPEEMLAAAYA